MIKKIVLSILLVCLGLVVISLNVLLLTSAGLQASVYLADRLLPGSLSIETVQGRLVNRFIFEGVQYSWDDGNVSLGHLSFSWHPISLLHKKFDIRSFLARDVSVTIHSQDKSPGSKKETTTPSPFIIPLALYIEKGTVENLIFFHDEQEERISSLVLQNLSAEEDFVRIGNCEIMSDAFQLSVQGQMQIADAFPTHLEIGYTIENEDFSTVAGTGVLDGTFRELAYSLHLNSPFSGSVKGVVLDVLGNPRWTAALLSEALSLEELNRAWPVMSMKDFNLTGEGNLESYSFQVRTSASYDMFQNIAVSAGISGDQTSLHLTDVRMNKEKMVLRAEGQLAWQDDLTWQVNFVGVNINPEQIDPRWPGKLDFEAAVSGSRHDEILQSKIDLQRLDGELRGYPLQADGEIMIDGSNFSVEQFHVQSADSFLQIAGNIGDPMGLDFCVIASNLETVWPELSGTIEGKGHIRGSPQNPDVQLDLSGKNISSGRTKIEDVSIQGVGIWGKQDSFMASFSAKELVVAETEIETFTATFHGALEKHQVNADISGPHFSVNFDLVGGYEQNKWGGHISGVTVQVDREGEWRQQEDADLSLSSGNIDLGKMCFAGMESARICVNGNYVNGEWKADTLIRSFPLSLLQDRQDKFDEIGGKLSGKVSVQGSEAELVSGKLEFDGDNVFSRQTVSEGYAPTITWKNISMSADIDRRILDAKLNGVLEDGSSFLAAGVLNDFSLFPLRWEDSGIIGNIDFNIVDLSPLSSISYPTVEPSGTLQGNMEIHGKLKNPEFRGRVNLDQGKLVFPEQGVAVENLSVSVDGKDEQFMLQLKGTSGDGPIRAAGTLALGEKGGDLLLLHISGEHVEIINFPEIKIRVSPDLQLKINRDHVNLQGQVLVTDALIAPKELKGGVTASRDVVIVDEKREEESPFPFEADLTVIAREKVRVRAFGLKGYIDGKLRVIILPARPIVFEGNLQVRDGTYSVYGRQLDIARGALAYQGSPPDNPGIDVRAENTASGVTTGIEVSGFLREPDVRFYSTPPMEQDEILKRILMNTSLVGSKEDEGFLESVASDTGTDPIASTVQDVKESLHIDDVKIESGKESDDLSLVIGTWITPELYISYGKNLLKESGNFNTKYMLGHGFFLETETGSTDSGVDLMYEIER